MDQGSPSTQLVVFRFAPGARFEGGLLGALERIETGGALRIRDALFLHRDAESGELEALSSTSDGAGRLVSSALDFRLDRAARRRRTKDALKGNERVRELADMLEPDEAMAALLVQHRWAEALDDSAGRMGGRLATSGFVEAQTLSELGPELLEAAGGSRA